MTTKRLSTTISDDIVVNKIYEIRNQKVMLDRDLAELYGIETKVLKQAVKRNMNRFPEKSKIDKVDAAIAFQTRL